MAVLASEVLRQFLCRLRSIATHRDHFVRCPSVCLSVRPSVTLLCHTFQSYVSQATHAFLGMLPLFLLLLSKHGRELDKTARTQCPLLSLCFRADLSTKGVNDTQLHGIRPFTYLEMFNQLNICRSKYCNCGNFCVGVIFAFFTLYLCKNYPHAEMKPMWIYEGNRSSIMIITPTWNVLRTF